MRQKKPLHEQFLPKFILEFMLHTLMFFKKMHVITHAEEQRTSSSASCDPRNTSQTRSDSFSSFKDELLVSSTAINDGLFRFILLLEQERGHTKPCLSNIKAGVTLSIVSCQKFMNKGRRTRWCIIVILRPLFYHRSFSSGLNVKIVIIY